MFVFPVQLPSVRQQVRCLTCITGVCVYVCVCVCVCVCVYLFTYLSFKHTCNTPATHLQHTCNIPATHLLLNLHHTTSNSLSPTHFKPPIYLLLYSFFNHSPLSLGHPVPLPNPSLPFLPSPSPSPVPTLPPLPSFT